MAVLGKRKSRASEPEGSTSKPDSESVQDIFRRHFEAQFAPLPEVTAGKKGHDDADPGSDESEEEEGEDEWGGLSDDGAGEHEDSDDQEASEEDDNVVEVVDHSSDAPKTKAMSKAELKAFMSSRPPDPTNTSPSATSTPSSSKQSSSTLPEDAPSLLAQDLELRRLISESHLLAPKPTFTTNITTSTTSNEPKLFASGRTRRKATDLRLQALGSKGSIYKQEKMPMNMRKGMVAARALTEAKRRREAKENGVVLEREVGGKKVKRKVRRDDSVDMPGIGRMKGAQLRISERDVKSIENSRDAFGRKRR
ncbi:hypothetical protein NLU13_2931 [Sarocladium strictum]|uniref:Protein FAF1 n=1 Tax=Sarocladium strictum TaxID=5046 RepID=A0AA39L998_SARSR|nr:hypothetical protein NLU13_2931 [Sarocladium strictum]